MALRKYLESIETVAFHRHKKELEERLSRAIKSNNTSKEEEIVRGIIKNIGSFETQDYQNQLSIITKSIFIHGRRSMVEFEYQDRKFRRELGDIIFIISVAFQGKKYFEKMTISQAKRYSTNGGWDLRNKGQLYLLSQFPPFKGIKGSIFPQKEYILPNCTGCLGTYLLLKQPDDLFLVSAVLMDHAFGSTQFLSSALRLHELQEYPISLYNFSRLLLHTVDLLKSYRCSYPPMRRMVVTCSYHFLDSVWSFVNGYLRSCVGEPIYIAGERYASNRSALLFIHDLMNTLRERSPEEEEFVNHFKKYSYYNSEFIDDPNNWDTNKEHRWEEYDKEEGGLGIVLTTIHLGGE